MAITNAQVIDWVNNVLRPMAEDMRNLDAEIDAALITWFAQISANTPNSGAETLEDGRDADGVSRLTGADINSFVTQMVAYQTQLNAAGVADVISKPTVRPLQVS